MRVAYIAHPYGGDPANVARAHAFAAHARRTLNVIPVVTHAAIDAGVYGNDRDPGERVVGIQMGLEILRRCDVLVAPEDTTLWSPGVEAEILSARAFNIPIRLLPWRTT